MVLQLSDPQIHLLHASLAESIEALRDEVVHTDERDLREHLKDKLERLLALQREVEAQMHPVAQPSL